MSKIRSSVIEPATGTTLTLGASGDTVAVSSDAIKLNTLKDSGGNTLFTSNGSGTLSSVNSSFSGAGPKLLSTQNADNSTSISFTSGIDSTYDRYMIVMTDVQPASANVHFRFNGSTDGGSNYNVTKTTTAFRATHQTGTYYFGYVDHSDLAQSTDYQILGRELGSDSDESFCGILNIFSPSSTTYIKQFYAETIWFNDYGGEGSMHYFIGGYMNTTSAVDAIDFNMASGNVNVGKFKLYGVS